MQDTPIPRAVDHLKLPPQYRDTRQHMFPSEGSLQWYIRQHRDALVKSGAILIIAGRIQIHAERFDAYVIRQGKAAAQRCTGAEK